MEYFDPLSENMELYNTHFSYFRFTYVASFIQLDLHRNGNIGQFLCNIHVPAYPCQYVHF